MESSSLHLCTHQTSISIINRSYTLFHFTALMALFYYRFLCFFLSSKPIIHHLLLFSSELLLSLIWFFHQAYQWRPVSRTTFQERLPENQELPGIDVFICTADPKKEPPIEVMNTVLSAMALDYLPEKISVYLSDDGGSSLTLKGLEEAHEFARSWVPFCRKFGIKNRCPMVFFSSLEDDLLHTQSMEYQEEKEKIKTKYEQFKERLEREEENNEEEDPRSSMANDDHPSLIQVMNNNCGLGINQVEIPLLVYVSREKKPSSSHHFKAGALNVLLRVSGILTNSPYILVLDCDMYCNDPTSAKQAMCFHLDPKISPSLAFVQFPQKFHNISENDIYDSQLRTIFVIKWPGMDGLQGPMLSGTGFYVKRNALYDNFPYKDIEQLKQYFGHSNEYIMSIQQINKYNMKINERNDSSSRTLQEAQFLAACTYEKHTLWGKQIGFWYNSVVEDYFTGFMLHCKGWISVLCNPSRPAFLGTATTNLNDTLVQGTRWNCGLMEVTFSRFCPLIYGFSRMSLLQTMCYGYAALHPLYSVPLWCLATLPQLCLLNGIPIYPKVSSSWFMIFAFIFLSSSLKHLQETLCSGGSVQTWRNEQQIWMIKSITSYTFGILDALLKWVGLKKASFLPTNKVANDEQITLYQKGKFNFQTSKMLLSPIVTLVILNIISLTGGVARIFFAGNWEEIFGQVFITIYILVVNFPVIEGMILRTDEGSVPSSVSLLSLVFSIIFLCLGSIAFI